MMGGVYPHHLSPDRSRGRPDARVRDDPAQPFLVYTILEDDVSPHLTHGDPPTISGLKNGISGDVDGPHHDSQVAFE